jgi:lipoprotein-anchoring transpeptidase ErfK/SrfK
MALALSTIALAATACAPISATVDFQTVTPSEQSQATVVAEPSGVKKVDPDQRIVVRANGGQLADVTITGPKGPVKGQISDDGTVWTAKKSALDFGATYTVSVTAVDARGVATTTTDQIRTKEPKSFVSGSVDPTKGDTVGAGTPITVRFDRPIKKRANIERAMVVYTPKPILGAWSWNSDSEVQFRPKKYWPGDIDVTVALNLKGVEAAHGVYGQDNTETTFHVGPQMVTKVNAASHVAKVYRNGKHLRTIPITTGKSGFETRSGVVLIVSKERTRIMDAATGGTSKTDPEYYRLEVEYAMRITYSGEFLHAAPWSVGSQGFANVSHGCVGMSTTNAAWLYDLSRPGDVVEITGTSSAQNLGNGITVWTESWDDWLKGSKVGAVPTTATVPDAATAAPTLPEPVNPTDPAADPAASAGPAAPYASTAPSAPSTTGTTQQTALHQ